MIQDGTERWFKKTLPEAIKSLKTAAKAFNNCKLETKDIEVYEERQVVPVTPQYEYVRIKV
jgi:hypothetical protein